MELAPHIMLVLGETLTAVSLLLVNWGKGFFKYTMLCSLPGYILGFLWHKKAAPLEVRKRRKLDVIFFGLLCFISLIASMSNIPIELDQSF